MYNAGYRRYKFLARQLVKTLSIAYAKNKRRNDRH